MGTFEQETRSGRRFRFGKNWRRFLSTLSPAQIADSERALRETLRIETLAGKRFLDVGSGSGLSSLAARRLGATVRSFDYDPESTACTEELKSRYFPNDPNWVIDRGSILDKAFLDSLGKFDVVYSWGVLHHTGDMWAALENAATLVNEGSGLLFIAIYNEDGIRSRVWLRVKKIYCSGFAGKFLVCSIFFPYFFLRTLAANIIVGHNAFRNRKRRGMSPVHDWIDWLGGMPYEVAKPEEIFHFCEQHGFALANLRTTNSHGNNVFVFVKTR